MPSIPHWYVAGWDRYSAAGSSFGSTSRAPPLGLPISATIWSVLPINKITGAGRAIAAEPAVRLCAATAGGRSNLVITVVMRTINDLHDYCVRL